MAMRYRKTINGITWYVDANGLDVNGATISVPLQAIYELTPTQIGNCVTALEPLARYATAMHVASYVLRSCSHRPDPQSAAEVISFGAILREFLDRGEREIDAALRIVERYEEYARNRLDTPAKRKEIAANYKSLMAELIRRSRSGACCAYCGGTSGLTIDHVVPLIRGGSNHIDNLQLLCRACNIAKSDG